MQTFDELKKICDTLCGPDGCPWDKKQTFQSLRPHLLEETHELLEAVDEDDAKKMVEELGDVLFQIVFYAKMGEMSGRFTLQEVIAGINEKLIRRHPHVFGDLAVKDADEVVRNWERIKSLEKKERKHALEGIPKTLGALARAQKVVGKMLKKEMSFPKVEEKQCREEVIGDQFIDLIVQACEEKVDAESAVRKALKKFERVFVKNSRF